MRKKLKSPPDPGIFVPKSHPYHYTIKWKDAGGVWRKTNGTHQLDVARSMLAKRRTEAAMKKEGLCDAYEEHRSRPLREHAASYLESLNASAESDWVRRVESKLEKAFKAMRAFTIQDLDLSKAVTFLNSLADTKKMKPKAVNEYGRSLRAFGKWLVSAKRVAVNPFEELRPRRVKDKDREMRLALSVQQLNALVGVAPEPRAKLYIFGFYTGLRRGELRDLDWGCIVFDSAKPYVVVKDAKNGKTEKVPLWPWLAETVQAWKAELEKSGPVQKSTKVFEVPWAISQHIRDDAEAADIPLEDEEGAVLRFHSLRHSTATYLVDVGHTPKAVQRFMRHSSLDMTLRIYAKKKWQDIPLDRVPAPECAAKAAFPTACPTACPNPWRTLTGSDA